VPCFHGLPQCLLENLCKSLTCKSFLLPLRSLLSPRISHTPQRSTARWCAVHLRSSYRCVRMAARYATTYRCGPHPAHQVQHGRPTPPVPAAGPHSRHRVQLSSQHSSPQAGYSPLEMLARDPRKYFYLGECLSMVDLSLMVGQSANSANSQPLVLPFPCCVSVVAVGAPRQLGTMGLRWGRPGPGSPPSPTVKGGVVLGAVGVLRWDDPKVDSPRGTLTPAGWEEQAFLAAEEREVFVPLPLGRPQLDPRRR
jgi:hypothetical protein